MPCRVRVHVENGLCKVLARLVYAAWLFPHAPHSTLAIEQGHGRIEPDTTTDPVTLMRYVLWLSMRVVH